MIYIAWLLMLLFQCSVSVIKAEDELKEPYNLAKKYSAGVIRIALANKQSQTFIPEVCTRFSKL